MRAAIRLDCAALPPGELIASATAFGLPAAERRLDQRRQPGVGQRRRAEARPGADHAFQPQHRDPVAPAEEIERILHRPDVGEPPAPGKAGPRPWRAGRHLLGADTPPEAPPERPLSRTSACRS